MPSTDRYFDFRIDKDCLIKTLPHLLNSLAIEKSCLDLNKLNDDPRERLLVIEGTLTDEMMGPELLQLLESGTFILKEDGQVVVKERKVCNKLTLL